jgi:hypothetical protein
MHVADLLEGVSPIPQKTPNDLEKKPKDDVEGDHF